MGYAAIPYVIAAAAAGAQIYNTNKTAKRQDAALAEGIRQKSRTQQKADKAISSELTALEGSRSGDEAATTLQQYQQALEGSQNTARAGQAIAGLSSEYDAATAASNKQSGQYVDKIAGLLSQIDAPLQQREGEGFRIGDLTSNLRILGREGEGQDFLSRMRAQGIRRNPWIDAAAAAANAYASGGMSAGASTGAGGVNTGFKAGMNTKG